MTRLTISPGYESLAAVLDEALAQAQSGKGSIRHATGQPFEEQPIIAISELLGTHHGDLFQAIKKAQESVRLKPGNAVHELLGAINYLAAAVILLKREEDEQHRAMSKSEAPSAPLWDTENPFGRSRQ